MNLNLFATLQRFFFIIVLIIAFFIILTYLLSMGLGILVLFSTAEGLKFSKNPYKLYPLHIINVEITVNAGLYFLFLWWVFALCFATAWQYREGLSYKVQRFLSDTVQRNPFSNNLLAMPLITSMLLIATLILHFLQAQWGFPTGSPLPSDPFMDFIRYSRAPLVEEILFRILPIGTFLMTYIFIVGKRTKPDYTWIQRLKTCILSVFQPERAKEEVGLKTISESGLFGGLIWAEWLMVFLTAFLFGIVHYLGGWGPGKISQAAMSGVVFALAYLYYGIQAPILFHWYFNYYFTVFSLSSSYYLTEIDFLSLCLTTNIFLGTLMWFAVTFFGIVFFLRVLRRKLKTTSVFEPLSTSV
ncbi:MAG: hypothetical protein ACE5KD_02340 [Candidatus Bathyarchaeia archaeon]